MDVKHTLVQVIPGIGYFGSSPADALVVDLAQDIYGVRLSLSDDVPAILNLTGIEFSNGNEPVNVNELALSFAQSSFYEDDERYGNKALIEKRAIHTKCELHPYWMMCVDAPISATTIRLLNRTDEWAKRSRSLRLQVQYSSGGIWETVYDGRSACAAVYAFEALSRAAGVPISFDTPSERLKVLGALHQRIRDGVVKLNEIDWRAILQFVDVWGDSHLSKVETDILAAKIYFEKTAFHKWVVKDTAYMFKTRSAVLGLQQAVGELAHHLGDKSEWTLTRHGLEPSQLRSKAVDFLAHMEVVCAHLSALSRDPILAYGTLLGAVRDKDFIAHDDDVDLLYRLEATSEDEANREVDQVAAYFGSLGYEPIRFFGTFNVQIICPKTGVAVDIFPYWVNGSSAFLHMDKMLIRELPTDILMPSTKIEFYGRTFGAPANPEGFLLARYGDGWNVSDQFFEWPWRLIDNTI